MAEIVHKQMSEMNNFAMVDFAENKKKRRNYTLDIEQSKII